MAPSITQNQVAGLWYATSVDNQIDPAFDLTLLKFDQTTLTFSMADGSITDLTEWLTDRAQTVLLNTLTANLLPVLRATVSIQTINTESTPVNKVITDPGDPNVQLFQVEIPSPYYGGFVWGMAHSVDGGFAMPGSAPSGGGGGVASVGADAPLLSSGGANPTISIDTTGAALDDVIKFDGSAWVAGPVPGGSSGPTQPPAWGTEYLWWQLDDAPQAGASPNVAVNSGSAGAASLTATTNATGGNSNGGAFYDKTPMFGVSGLYSSVARFRGSTNTLQGAAGIYTGTTAFTLSAWANVSESGGSFNCNIVTKKHPSGYSVGILTLGARAYFLVRTAGGEVTYYTAQYIMEYGLPQMLSLTYDGTTIRGYINGQEVVSGAQTGNIVWTSGAGSEWEIGQPSGGIERYDVWDVRVAPAVRSAAQLLADYKTGLGLTY